MGEKKENCETQIGTGGEVKWRGGYRRGVRMREEKVGRRVKMREV